jgi:hypothetical protein
MKGYLKEVDNAERELNSNATYFRTLVWNGDMWETLLMTDGELERMRERRGKNPDMCVKASFWDKLSKWLGW